MVAHTIAVGLFWISGLLASVTPGLEPVQPVIAAAAATEAPPPPAPKNVSCPNYPNCD